MLSREEVKEAIRKRAEEATETAISAKEGVILDKDSQEIIFGESDGGECGSVDDTVSFSPSKIWWGIVLLVSIGGLLIAIFG